MSERTEWTFKTISAVISFIMIVIPFWTLFWPIIFIYRLPEAILQSYLLRAQEEEWNKMYQDCRKQRLYIDYPSTRGSLMTELLQMKWFVDDNDE